MLVSRFFKSTLYKSKRILIVLVVVVVGLLIYLKVFNRTEQPQFQTAKVERGTIVSTISATGSVISTSFVYVTTSATGIVREVYVKDGDKVSQGQKIADIDLDEAGKLRYSQAWANYLSAKNSLEAAKANLYTLNSQMWAANQKFINDAVARGLAEDDPIYIQEHNDWLAAEAKYKNQQAVIKQAEEQVRSAWLSYQLSSPTITAPVSGIVNNLTIIPGLVLGQEIEGSVQSPTSFRVATITKSKINPVMRINISEADIPKVKIGQKATITFDALPGKTFTGKVAAVDRVGTVSNNVTSYTSLIQLDADVPEIHSNVVGSANIIVETKANVLLVPSSGVLIQGDQSFVRILRDGREQQIPVEVGISSDTQTEIVSGLSEGEDVIVGVINNQPSQEGSIFSGGGFGGGAFRPGGAIFRTR